MGRPFEGKVVLVTGASSGLGETAAVLLAEAGATVFGTARRRESLDAARARHPQIRWLVADVTDASAVKVAVEGVVPARSGPKPSTCGPMCAKTPTCATTGTSEEIARAIVFIGSDGASFITGTIFGVDGGMLA